MLCKLGYIVNTIHKQTTLDFFSVYSCFHYITWWGIFCKKSFNAIMHLICKQILHGWTEWMHCAHSAGQMRHMHHCLKGLRLYCVMVTLHLKRNMQCICVKTGLLFSARVQFTHLVFSFSAALPLLRGAEFPFVFALGSLHSDGWGLRNNLQ